MIFNLSRKKPVLTKEEQAEQYRNITANEFVNVRDIRGNFLYSKDNYIFSYLKIEPISLDLLSHTEKIRRTKLFTAELASEQNKFKMFSISQPVDISHIIQSYHSILQTSDEMIQKELIKQEIRAISDFALTGEVIERLFWMVIWEEEGVDAENDLKKRAEDLKLKLYSCKITARLAEENEIVKLCNLFANPSYSHFEDESIEATIPLLNMNRR